MLCHSHSLWSTGLLNFICKNAKAGEDCRQAELAFIPLAADTLGSWRRVANEQVTKLAVAQARQIGEMEDVTTRLLRQRLSLLLMKGNSALLIGRVPEEQHHDDDLI